MLDDDFDYPPWAWVLLLVLVAVMVLVSCFAGPPPAQPVAQLHPSHQGQQAPSKPAGGDDDQDRNGSWLLFGL
ncbi:MAG: hypothetical protein NTY30_01200 [Candidatus Berkelbacteria bacterium]|nr:hypothetical protein [Candidatus Berkelbacteria bacterium]